MFYLECGDYKSILEVNKFRHTFAYFRLDIGKWDNRLRGRYFSGYNSYPDDYVSYLKLQTSPEVLLNRAVAVDKEMQLVAKKKKVISLLIDCLILPFNINLLERGIIN